LALVLLFLWGARTIFRSERRNQESYQEAESRALRYENISTKRAYIGLTIASLAIVGSGIWLAIIGDELATATGWGATFVGSLFLAATTSLPELVVSITALRLGAIDMAIANILGSNMLNMGIVIASVDLFYRHGSIFSASSTGHVFTAAIAVLMTLIVIAGLTLRPQKKTLIGISWYSIVLIGAYVIGAYILFARGVVTW
jgi:cation:H+ antiporter